MLLSNSSSLINSPDFHSIRIPTVDPAVGNSPNQLSETDEKTQEVAMQQVVLSNSNVVVNNSNDQLSKIEDKKLDLRIAESSLRNNSEEKKNNRNDVKKILQDMRFNDQHIIDLSNRGRYMMEYIQLSESADERIPKLRLLTEEYGKLEDEESKLRSEVRELEHEIDRLTHDNQHPCLTRNRKMCLGGTVGGVLIAAFLGGFGYLLYLYTQEDCNPCM